MTERVYPTKSEYE